MKELDNAKLTKLKDLVEKAVGCPMKTPRNFTFLSHQIQDLTSQTISVSTLKRLWGYTNNQYGVSEFTLNLLAKVVGYTNWEHFCNDTDQDNEEDGEHATSDPSSHAVVVRRLCTGSLMAGDQIKLTWGPNRSVLIQYDGLDKFHVVAAENSKLKIGDRFQASIFVEGQPLLLCGLQCEDMPPVDYQCGMRGGIRWKFIPKDEVQS